MPELPADLLNLVDRILKHIEDVKNRVIRPILQAQSNNNAKFLVNVRAKFQAFVTKCIQILQLHQEGVIIAPGHKDYPSWAGMQDRDVYHFT